MARVHRSNPLIRRKGEIRGIYGEFLRVKNSLCAKSTISIYKDLGDRIYIPQLTELTNDDLSTVTASDLRVIVEDYAADHNQGGVDFVWRHLKTFINWYWDEYDLPTACPTKKVKIKKPAVKPIPGITHDEIQAMIKSAKAHSVFPERDIAMIMILSDTGIRRRSLLELKMGDVDTRSAELITHEKDQRFHIHSFGSATTKAINAYLNCLEDVKPTDPFWLKMDGVALSTYGAKEILRRLCQESGIPMHHFHDFRRFYALELYKSTRDIYMVSRALDHKNIEVTKRYLNVDDLENAEAVRSYSPMDKHLKQTGVSVRR